MSRTTISIIIGIFLLVVVGLFVTSYVMRSPAPDSSNTAATSTNQATSTTTIAPRITAKHFFSDGIHTLVGEIDMPTPCDLLDHETVVQESMPEQVRIDFTVINNADTCAQVITAQRFMVEVEASEEATFTATLRGESAELNLVPAAPGETPDEFELFIKG